MIASVAFVNVTNDFVWLVGIAQVTEFCVSEATIITSDLNRMCDISAILHNVLPLLRLCSSHSSSRR